MIIEYLSNKVKMKKDSDSCHLDDEDKKSFLVYVSLFRILIISIFQKFLVKRLPVLFTPLEAQNLS